MQTIIHELPLFYLSSSVGAHERRCPYMFRCNNKFATRIARGNYTARDSATNYSEVDWSLLCNGVTRIFVTKQLELLIVLVHVVSSTTCWLACCLCPHSASAGRTLTRDPHVRCQATLSKIVVHLQSIQRAMSLLLSLPKVHVLQGR